MGKIQTYFAIAVLLILIIGGLFAVKNMNGSVVKESKSNNVDLSKYRSEDIPEKCRLPDYENDLGWWKTHLGHHAETNECLQYFE
jgi:amino acid transporter